jgi:hypothetical protein
MVLTEVEPNFVTTNLHGGGHFGIGGSLGDMGDAYNSPGGWPFYTYIHARGQVLISNRPTILPAPCEPRSSLLGMAKDRPAGASQRCLWPNLHV